MEQEARTQFTFYDSFFRAVSRIRKATDRAAAYDAICAYALYGTKPELDKLPDAAAVAFEVAKPNLDASRRKANSGKKGGESKHGGSKPEAKPSKAEANAKQSQAKPKQVKEQEKEQEQDKEQMLNPLPPLPDAGPELQAAFGDWLKYKAERREGYKPTGLKNLETEVRNNANRYGEAAVAALIRHCMASGWRGIIFDKLKEAPRQRGTEFQTGNPFLEMLHEERGR